MPRASWTLFTFPPAPAAPSADGLAPHRAERHARVAGERRAIAWANLREIARLCRTCPAVRIWWRSRARFARELRGKLDRYAFTTKQMAAVRRAAVGALARVRTWSHQYQDRQGPVLLPAAAAPAGRWEGDLVLRFWKVKCSDYGDTFKGLWQHPDEGWMVWCTIPRLTGQWDCGTRVRLRVSLEPKADDPTVAWGTRPVVASAAA